MVVFKLIIFTNNCNLEKDVLPSNYMSILCL